MDRYLIAGATLLLFLEVGVLLSDLGLVSPFSTRSKVSQSEVMGKVIIARENVRRRANDSLMWQNSKKEDSVYAMDSILTLKNSSATIKLNQDINLDIQENTLIVIEPDTQSKDGNIRLRFQRGHLRSKNNKPMQVESGDWTISAVKGTDLQISSGNDDSLQVEIKEGEIKLTGELGEQELKGSHKFEIKDNEIKNVINISEEIKFSLPEKFRLYSHNFPIKYKVQWEGSAQQLEINEVNGSSKKLPVENLNEISLDLKIGSYILNLTNKDTSSSSHLVQVLPAKKIVHYSPLARDRFPMTKPVPFFWSEVEGAKSYKLVLDKNGKPQSGESNLNRLTFIPASEGFYSWKVEAYDDEGYKIPAFYKYPVYFLENPLPAPIINKPKVRAPASIKEKNPEQKRPNSSSLENGFFNKLLNIVLPRVYANENIENDPPKEREVFFEWSEVEGADFYLVEVAKDPQFEKIAVQKRVFENKFLWKESYLRDIYFLRVAGGNKNGQMGLFSPPQSVNLKEIEIHPEKVGFTNPLVDFKPNLITHSPTNAPLKTEVETIKLQNKKENQSTSVNPLFSLRLWLGASYSLVKFENESDEENFEAELSGLNSFYFGTQIRYKKYLVDTNVFLGEWEPKDNLIFQDNLETWSGGLSIHYQIGKKFYIGPELLSKNILIRTNYETIDLENQDFYGLGSIWKSDLKKWELQIHPLIFSKDSYNGGQINLQINRLFPLQGWDILMGTDLNFYTITRDDEKLEGGEFNFLLGTEW